MADTIWVTAGPKAAPGRVALWEVDDAHPDGELWVDHASEAVEAAPTSGVRRAIGAGTLAEADAPAEASAAPQVPATMTVAALRDHLATLTDPDAVQALRDAEAAGENRKTALEAIDAHAAMLESEDA